MYSYLALGDSYTIGEQVLYKDNFPNQTVDLLRNNNRLIADPVIIATTGWTTDELATAIMEHNIHETFSLVTLLVGVNNQYRGRTVEGFRDEFAQLLNQAIGFAGGVPNHVFVLSIPDWGATPFAEGKDRVAVAKGIDAYNSACEEIARNANCHYIEITESTREHGNDPEYLVEDILHPSGKEYTIWSERLAAQVAEVLPENL